MSIKNTAFTQKHIDLGAKMAEFAGYNMPISYTGINDEHAAVRKMPECLMLVIWVSLF